MTAALILLGLVVFGFVGGVIQCYFEAQARRKEAAKYGERIV